MADVRVIYFHTEEGTILAWKCERGAHVSIDGNQPYCTWPCMARNVVRIVDSDRMDFTLSEAAPCLALYVNPEERCYVFVPYDPRKSAVPKVLAYTRFSRFNGGLQHLYVPRCYAVPLCEDRYIEDDVSMLNRGKLAIVSRNVSVRKQPIMLPPALSTAPPVNNIVMAAFPKVPVPTSLTTGRPRLPSQQQSQQSSQPQQPQQSQPQPPAAVVQHGRKKTRTKSKMGQ